MAKTEKDSVEAPKEEAKTEEQDHADNAAAAETPAVVEGRRDGNGALIVN